MSTYHPKNKLAVAVSAALVFFSTASLAQEKPAKATGPIEEVVVTGSAIVREDLEGSLPIQILDVADIARTGVTNTGDLVAQLPAMQGFTTPADSIGGGGGGIQTANIHNIGSAYTLSLLNGRRLAPSGSGSSIDLRAIPVSLLETVEVLTDGASALYGSDAIAGVVNFKLKSEVDETRISVSHDAPLESGGKSFSFDLTTGFGDFEEDGYSLVAGFTHQKREALSSSERDFAKTGSLIFRHPDLNQDVLYFRGSSNAIPGNAIVTYIDPSIIDKPETKKIDERKLTYSFNPYYQANGDKCATSNSPRLIAAGAGSVAGEQCFFDFTSTIEIIPEQESNSLLLNGRAAINDDLTAYGTLVYTDSSTISRTAPYPTGNVPLENDSQLVADYILPYLTDVQKDNLVSVTGSWRALAAGNRTTEYSSKALNAVFGLEGTFNDITYDTAIAYSRNDRDEVYPSGFLLLKEFNQLVRSGGLNIFVESEDIPESERAALASTIYSGDWSNSKTEVVSIDAKGSMPLIEMSGGESVLAAGFEVRNFNYKDSAADANIDELLLFLSASTPFDLSRSQWGMFAEYFMPVIDGVELTASLRYDSIGGVRDSSTRKSDDGTFVSTNKTVGNTESDLTYKLTARWDATENIALRASYGTGFKAPSLRQIAEPRSSFGVTSGSYDCPFKPTDDLAAFCLPGEKQYGVFREGSANLKPETSTQYTTGFVFRPDNGMNITVDYWNVEIENIVERLTQDQIFTNAELYRDLFTSRINNSTKAEELAIIQGAVNGGTFDSSGVDYSFTQGFETAIGDLTAGISGTYLIESDSSLNGTSLGRFGSDEAVAFRNRVQLSVGLDHGIFAHGIIANFRSGYLDQAQTVNLIDENTGEIDFATQTPIQLKVPSYTTIDYQATLDLMDEQLNLTLGIKNLADKQPPLSLRSSGAGHQVGWDPRYVDAYGRTVYLKASFGF